MSRAEVGEVYEASTTALEAAKGQRLSLRRAIGQLEEALTEPAVGRAKDWAANLEPVLDDLKTVFSVHVEVTEGAGGLYEEIVGLSPRLAGTVDRLRAEHPEITEAVTQMVARLEHVEIGGPEWPLDDARDDLQRFIGKVIRHRQRGADLVWEAYNVDIGGPE